MSDATDGRPGLADRYLGALDLARRQPTLDFLAEINRRHVAELAFSSVGPRLGADLPLDRESLFDRIVVRRRGGYCFEQNGLLFEVLSELGYDPKIQMARVILNQDIHPGLTHRVSRVDIDGRSYIVDVGFGPMGPTQPVPIAVDGPAPTDFRVHEVTPGVYHVQRSVDGDWFSLYRFELVAYGQSDAELGHFYSHRHPAAVFVNNLVASRILDDEVRSLRNREYWVIRDIDPVARAVGSADHLHHLLTDEIGLAVTREESERLWGDLPPVAD